MILIQEDSKKILEYMLNKTISLGDLNEPLCIRYDTLADELHLKNENYCRVCCQYLNELHYIHILSNEDNKRSICIKAKGIDFLESTQHF